MPIALRTLLFLFLGFAAAVAATAALPDTASSKKQHHGHKGHGHKGHHGRKHHPKRRCDGREATIDLEKHARKVHGTKGNDVIVANGSVRVYGRGGSDLICTGSGSDR